MGRRGFNVCLIRKERLRRASAVGEPGRRRNHEGTLHAVLARVLTDIDSLEQFAPGWDALAVSHRRPRSAPVFTLAWYRHALPPGAQIRAIVVTDGDSVVGAAPFYVVRTGFGFYQYNMPVPLLFGVEPLFVAGREEEIAAAVGLALTQGQPVPDMVFLDSLPQGSPWPTFIRQGWPRPQPTLVTPHSFPWPHVHLADGGFDAWLQGRSGDFRKNFRSSHRKLQAAGFEYRGSIDGRDITDRIPDFRRLYEARRARRHGAGPAFDDAFTAIVTEAAKTLSGTGRLRLATIERPGEVIAANLIVSAGGHASGWYMGFADAWARLSPSFVCIVLSIQDVAQGGGTTYDLGAGAYAQKSRFTDDQPIFESSLLVRRGLRPLHTPVQVVPFHARKAMGRFLGRLRSLSTGRPAGGRNRNPDE